MSEKGGRNADNNPDVLKGCLLGSPFSGGRGRLSHRGLCGMAKASRTVRSGTCKSGAPIGSVKCLWGWGLAVAWAPSRSHSEANQLRCRLQCPRSRDARTIWVRGRHLGVSYRIGVIEEPLGGPGR